MQILLIFCSGRRVSLRQCLAALMTRSGRPAMAAVVLASILTTCPAYMSQLPLVDAESMVCTGPVKTDPVDWVPLANTNTNTDMSMNTITPLSLVTIQDNKKLDLAVSSA